MRGITHYIEIQQRKPLTPGTDVDDFAEVDRPWTNYAQAYATVEPLNGREMVNVQEVHGTSDYKLVMRSQSGITSQMRVKFGDRVLEITGIKPSGDTSRDMTLFCKEQNIAS